MREITNGNCFEIAAKIVGGEIWACGSLEAMTGIEAIRAHGAEDPKMVHATVTRHHDGREHAHAWIEAGDLVFDFSNGLEVVMPAGAYHDLGKVKNIKTYTKEETRRALLSTEHYGPWD